MRLIDGETLKEKFKEHYDIFVSAYENEQDMSLADKSRVDEILNSMAEVINAPTVCDIEQIRDEYKTPCSLCRHREDTSGLCDMCPAMPFEKGE